MKRTIKVEVSFELPAIIPGDDAAAMIRLFVRDAIQYKMAISSYTWNPRSVCTRIVGIWRNSI